MRRRSRQHGFTLLELVLVMLIACTALAIAAPKLGGFRRGAAMRATADQFLTLAGLARTNAISNGTVYRIQFDTQAGKFWLSSQQPGSQKQGTNDFVRDTTNFGHDVTLPEGGRMELTKTIVANASADNASTACIDFFPSGRVQPATIKFIDSMGAIIEVACESPADNFRIMPEVTR